MNTKQELLDWLVNNQELVEQIIIQTTKVVDPLFYEEYKEQEFNELKRKIMDEVSLSLGLHCDEFHGTIEDKELARYLDKVKEKC